ncbi:MAG: hypothetical protein AB1806_06675 [Acidobacteriota bacterium]
MRGSSWYSMVVVASATVLAGCEALKSSNPTSPSVAGPIPGVNITAPVLLEPGAGARIRAQDQPITLLIENASTNGERPISLTFEIATDADFNNRVFTREGVPPGSGGRTSLRLPDALAADRTYYWRSRALDGANTGPFSSPLNFQVYTPVELETPMPLAPVGDVRLSSRRPEFAVRNATRSGPVGQISYVFEIAEDEAFTVVEAVVTVAEQTIETRFTIAQELKIDRRYFWRVRAYDPSVTTPWSATQAFRTPEPAPTPAPSPAPPSGGWPTSGPEVAAWVESRYPERLAGGISLDERNANMEFLRDRMLEAGICGGLDLALNLKRGGPELSLDFIAYNKGGTWWGVDIGAGSKNTAERLHLQWAEYPPSVGVYPTPFPPPNCK